MPRNYLKPVVWQSQARLRQKERENVFRQVQCHFQRNDTSSEEHAQIHLQQQTKEGERQILIGRNDQERIEGFEKMSLSTYC